MKTLHVDGRKTLVLVTIAEVAQLVTLPTFQRPEDSEHVQVIQHALVSQWTTTQRLEMVGQFQLGRLGDEYYLLDGQHRLAALRACLALDPLMNNEQVDATIYKCDTQEDLYDVYAKLNTNKKVELYISRDFTVIANGIVKYLKEQYKSFMKNSERPQCPNLNVAQLVRVLEQRQVMQHTLISNATQFIDKLEELNVYYRSLTLPQLKSLGCKDLDKVVELTTAHKRPLMLGLWRQYEWVDRIVQRCTTGAAYSSMEHVFVYTQTKLPRRVRHQLWHQRFGDNMQGHCHCCKQAVRVLDAWHAGHKKSRASGGSDELSNLEVTCTTCNLEMGTMDMDTYAFRFPKGMSKQEWAQVV